MSTAPTRAEGTDALADLEERIVRAVQLVNQLRQEKDATEARLETALSGKQAAEKTIGELEEQNLVLMEEVETLRNERKDVRTRIEKLLGQVDQLST
jgi:chromosome segregation ATPase